MDATNEVIRSIPEETRMQAFKGMCGPGFLKNESNDVRQEFQKLWFDENLSIEQKQTEFKRLAAQKLSGSAVSAESWKLDLENLHFS